MNTQLRFGGAATVSARIPVIFIVESPWMVMRSGEEDCSVPIPQSVARLRADAAQGLAWVGRVKRR
jgi:hypothetical protein